MLYGARKTVSLNKHRFNVVDQTYNRSTNAKTPFDKLKSIAGSSMPPYEAELAPHIDKNAFVARLWGSAHQQYLDKTPTSGWEIIDGVFQIVWFNGDQLPSSLLPEIDSSYHVERNDIDDDHYPHLAEMETSDEDSDDDYDST